ncbi:hypothetical protein ACFL6I_07425 [candidate division KSB1 bacterium]
MNAPFVKGPAFAQENRLGEIFCQSLMAKDSALLICPVIPVRTQVMMSNIGMFVAEIKGKPE